MSATDDTYVSGAELEAAFLAAREHGKILGDDVLRAIILAARNAGLRGASGDCLVSYQK